MIIVAENVTESWHNLRRDARCNLSISRVAWIHSFARPSPQIDSFILPGCRENNPITQTANRENSVLTRWTYSPKKEIAENFTNTAYAQKKKILLYKNSSVTKRFV
jgi:hypothetical protein